MLSDKVSGFILVPTDYDIEQTWVHGIYHPDINTFAFLYIYAGHLMLCIAGFVIVAISYQNKSTINNTLINASVNCCRT